MASRVRDWDADFATDILDLSSTQRKYCAIPVSGGRGRPVIDLRTLVIPGVNQSVGPKNSSTNGTNDQHAKQSLAKGKGRGRGRMLKIGEQLGNQNGQSIIKTLEAMDAKAKVHRGIGKQNIIFNQDEFPSLGSSAPPVWGEKAGKENKSKEQRKKSNDSNDSTSITDMAVKKNHVLDDDDNIYRNFPRSFLEHVSLPEQSVLVQNISTKMTYRDVSEYFESFGTVRSLVIRDSDALVTMSAPLACSWIVSCLHETRDSLAKEDALLKSYIVDEVLKGRRFK